MSMSRSPLTSGLQAITHHEAESDPVLVKLMAPSAVESLVATLKKRKGFGPDGVSSEKLQAGGSAVAVKLADIRERVILGASWPFGWTGGRIHDIHKHKGNPADCDNSRGILLMSHCGLVPFFLRDCGLPSSKSFQQFSSPKLTRLISSDFKCARSPPPSKSNHTFSKPPAPAKIRNL